MQFPNHSKNNQHVQTMYVYNLIDFQKSKKWEIFSIFTEIYFFRGQVGMFRNVELSM